MTALRLTLTATVPLPKNARDAVRMVIDCGHHFNEMAAVMAASGIPGKFQMEQVDEDAPPAAPPAAPKPERRKRRTRAELDAARATEVREPPPLGAVTLAGNDDDLLHIPDHLKMENRRGAKAGVQV